jgi:hypothetical protein
MLAFLSIDRCWPGAGLAHGLAHGLSGPDCAPGKTLRRASRYNAVARAHLPRVVAAVYYTTASSSRGPGSRGEETVTMAMPRIRPLGPDETTPEARDVLERFQRERGNMPNMFRTMALRPEIMQTAVEHMRAVFSTGTVETRLKEMLAVRVSQINDCHY